MGTLVQQLGFSVDDMWASENVELLRETQITSALARLVWSSTIDYTPCKLYSHPPSITKNIPKSIGRRLNTISSSEAEFNNAKDDYQQALSEAGYSEKLTYDPEQSRPTRGTKRRRRNIVWFNPP